MGKQTDYELLVRMTAEQERYVREEAARLNMPVSTFLVIAAMGELKCTTERPLEEPTAATNEKIGMVRHQTYTTKVRLNNVQKQYCWERARRLGVSVSSFIVRAATGQIKAQGESLQREKKVAPDAE